MPTLMIAVRMQSGVFRMIGRTSIVQGVPGFPTLQPAAYRYICSGEVQPDHDSPVADSILEKLLEQVSVFWSYEWCVHIGVRPEKIAG